MVGIDRSAAVATLMSVAVMTTSVLADDYVIDGQDVIMAVGMGQTSDGKSLDMMLLEMEGNTVHLNSAFVFTTQTEGTTFYVGVGDNVPRLICAQKSKEKRLSAMQTVKKIGGYNIVGTYDVYKGGVIFLTECDFEYVP
jgi:hypothetical protein